MCPMPPEQRADAMIPCALPAKLKPSGPPKTLCRDLPKRQAYATKMLETPKAIRMKNAIEAEVIVEHRVEGMEEDAEEEEDGDGGEESARRHSAPASSLYMLAPSLNAGPVGRGASIMTVNSAVEEGGSDSGTCRRHSAPAGTLHMLMPGAYSEGAADELQNHDRGQEL